jgi:hypothetical protein
MEGNIQNQPHNNLTYQLELIYFSFYDGELLWDIMPEQYSLYIVEFTVSRHRWIITQTKTTEEILLLINLIYFLFNIFEFHHFEVEKHNEVG